LTASHPRHIYAVPAATAAAALVARTAKITVQYDF